MKATSGAVALETVQRLKQRNDQMALFLVDQRMPGMEGVAFLAEAMKFYPNARKVLLTAYADTQAAIAAAPGCASRLRAPGLLMNSKRLTGVPESFAMIAFSMSRSYSLAGLRNPSATSTIVCSSGK